MAYFADGDNSDKVLALTDLTCHHVLFKTDGAANDDFIFAGAGVPRRNVQLLGTRAFDNLLNSIKMRIGRHGIMVEIYKEQIRRLEAREGGDEEEGEEGLGELAKTQVLDEAINAIEDLEKFYETRRSRRNGASPASAPSATSIPPPASPSTSVPKASRRTGARSSSTVPSLMVTLRYGDPIRLVHLEDVSPR
jgi:hypothetical protein